MYFHLFTLFMPSGSSASLKNCPPTDLTETDRLLRRYTKYDNTRDAQEYDSSNNSPDPHGVQVLGLGGYVG
ncbi:MAG TPA: hypothetical protein DGU45_07020 [Planctomycetes bacterium]|nr:hypothetical protein [Planctomycetota bacterium]